jgi:hypothetical protein
MAPAEPQHSASRTILLAWVTLRRTSREGCSGRAAEARRVEACRRRARWGGGGGAPPPDHHLYTRVRLSYTRVNPKIRGNANLAGAWSAQPVPASPPRAAHTQACRRACPAHDAGVHLRRRLGPANSLSAVRVRGWRAVVKDAGVRPPNDGQAAADDARPRPPENAPQRRCTRRACMEIDPQRLVHAPHPHLPPLRRRLHLCRLPREAVQRLAHFQRTTRRPTNERPTRESSLKSIAPRI